ncbi:reverse transcriptase [compost metagenome]
MKHQVCAKHYIRYVDDFVLLHQSPQWLNAAHAEIDAFLPRRLGAQLNPAKTILQPVARGVDFVGQVVRPWVRTTRARTVNEGARRLGQMEATEVHASVNSYLGLLRQATGSHHAQARLANIARRRGHAINGDITKAYRAPRNQTQMETS